MKIFSITIALLLLGCAAFSQAGLPDPDFDTDGIVITDINDYNSGYAVAISPLGKIVIAGETKIGPEYHFALAQYLPDGSPDSSFGIDGKVTLLIGEISYAKSLIVLADNSILVSGYAYLNFYDFAIARFFSNGIIDSSFGTNGIVTTDLDDWNEDYASSMALQNDGKIVLSGYIGYPQTQDFAVARYHPDGSLDSTFGMNGIVITNLPYDYDAGRDLAIQSDGKILLAGNSDEPFTMVRYNSDGTLDSSFNGTGVVGTSIGTDADGAKIETLPDGRILFLGCAHDGSDQSLILRYLDNGSLDSTWGTNGILSVSFDSISALCSCLLLQPDGKIIVAGTNGYPTGNDFAFYRLNADGSLDSTLNSTGYVTTNIDTSDICRSIALQPDGKLIAAGTTSPVTWNPYIDTKFVTVRYLMDLSVAAQDILKSSPAVFVYPNPLSDHTIFKYHLPEAAIVTLQLLDLDGKTIRTFFSESRSEGKHTEELTLEGISAGVYLLQLKANEKSASIKIIKQ